MLQLTNDKIMLFQPRQSPLASVPNVNM